MKDRKGFIQPILLLIIVFVILYLSGWDVREIIQDIADFLYRIVQAVARFVENLLN